MIASLVSSDLGRTEQYKFEHEGHWTEVRRGVLGQEVNRLGELLICAPFLGRRGRAPSSFLMMTYRQLRHPKR